MAGETALVKNAPDRSRLSRAEIALLFQLHKDGLTQTEIAQRLGCNQPTVSKWLATLKDTTTVAKEYLRGSALRMAENIVKKGRAADHIKALEGINVLTPEQKQTVTWAIGGVTADRVRLLTSTFALEASTVSADTHSVTADTGSDNS